MGYGNVMIQTAAGLGATTYFGVENPRELKDTITSMQEDYSRPGAFENTTAFATTTNNIASIADELEKIFELKQRGVLSEDEYNNLKTKILKS